MLERKNDQYLDEATYVQIDKPDILFDAFENAAKVTDLKEKQRLHEEIIALLQNNTDHPRYEEYVIKLLLEISYMLEPVNSGVVNYTFPLSDTSLLSFIRTIQAPKLIPMTIASLLFYTFAKAGDDQILTTTKYAKELIDERKLRNENLALIFYNLGVNNQFDLKSRCLLLDNSLSLTQSRLLIAKNYFELINIKITALNIDNIQKEKDLILNILKEQKESELNEKDDTIAKRWLEEIITPLFKMKSANAAEYIEIFIPYVLSFTSLDTPEGLQLTKDLKDLLFLHYFECKNYDKAFECLSDWNKAEKTQPVNRVTYNPLEFALLLVKHERYAELSQFLKYNNHYQTLMSHLAKLSDKKHFEEIFNLLLNEKTVKIFEECATELDSHAICYAAQEGNIDFVKTLLEQGANPNLKGPNGTALIIAIKNGYTDIVKLLLENPKLNPIQHVLPNGQTAIDVAIEEKATSILEVFKKSDFAYRTIDQQPSLLDQAYEKANTLNVSDSRIQENHNRMYILLKYSDPSSSKFKEYFLKLILAISELFVAKPTKSEYIIPDISQLFELISKDTPEMRLISNLISNIYLFKNRFTEERILAESSNTEELKKLISENPINNEILAVICINIANIYRIKDAGWYWSPYHFGKVVNIGEYDQIIKNLFEISNLITKDQSIIRENLFKLIEFKLAMLPKFLSDRTWGFRLESDYLPRIKKDVDQITTILEDQKSIDVPNNAEAIKWFNNIIEPLLKKEASFCTVIIPYVLTFTSSKTEEDRIFINKLKYLLFQALLETREYEKAFNFYFNSGNSLSKPSDVYNVDGLMEAALFLAKQKRYADFKSFVNAPSHLYHIIKQCNQFLIGNRVDDLRLLLETFNNNDLLDQVRDTRVDGGTLLYFAGVSGDLSTFQYLFDKQFKLYAPKKDSYTDSFIHDLILRAKENPAKIGNYAEILKIVTAAFPEELTYEDVKKDIQRFNKSRELSALFAVLESKAIPQENAQQMDPRESESEIKLSRLSSLFAPPVTSTTSDSSTLDNDSFDLMQPPESDDEDWTKIPNPRKQPG